MAMIFRKEKHLNGIKQTVAPEWPFGIKTQDPGGIRPILYQTMASHLKKSRVTPDPHTTSIKPSYGSGKTIQLFLRERIPMQSTTMIVYSVLQEMMGRPKYWWR